MIYPSSLPQRMRRAPRHKTLKLVLGFLFLTASTMPAETAQQSAATLAILASKDGRVEQTDASGRSVTLSRFDSFIPQGQTLRTGHTSFASLVLSNGLALYLGADTELTIESVQTTATPTGYYKRDFEPAPSTVKLQLLRGSLTLSHPNRRASSIIYLDADNTELQLLGEAFVAVKSNTELTLNVLQGTAYFIGSDGQRKDFVQAGQALSSSLFHTDRATNSRLTAAELRQFQAYVHLADAAANSILFQFPDPATTDSIRAVVVREASHFRKKPVDDYYLGGRNY